VVQLPMAGSGGARSQFPSARQVAAAFLAADARCLRETGGGGGTTAVLALCQPRLDRPATADVTVVNVGDSRPGEIPPQPRRGEV